MIYFDNAASAMPLKKTLEAFNKIAKEHFSNPAALHKGGIEAEKVITAARGTILKELPKNGSFIFTSGATESNNMAIINSVKQRGKTKTVTTTIEHPSVDNVIGTGDNTVRVFPSQIIEAVDDSTALVSVTSVCGETGFIVDTKQIFAEIKKRFPACIIHVDGVQGFLKNVPLDADLISVSAHKIGGLTGVGGLFVGDGIRLNPMLRGGGQQKGLRPGTEPTALIAAFGAAVDATVAEKPDIKPLCDRLISGLNILNLKINGRISECVPDIVNFSCGVKSEIMLHFLAEHNIYVSSGSACSKGKKSKILPAYGIPDKDIDTAIRISFGRQNTLDEVDTFLNVLEKGVKRWK